MGNTEDKGNDSYFMNIKIIGSNIGNFYNEIQNAEKEIKKLWNFEPLDENNEIILQINNYFQKLGQNLEENNDNKNIREVLILKVNHIFDPLVSLVIDLMNKLDEVQYMPLVLLLHLEECENKLEIDTNRFQQIDPRLIFTNRYSEDPEIIKREIDPILLRFCSIHNDLGDRFIIGNEKNNNENGIDLVDKYFPFNINLACIGRFRQGKSTGVNAILREYKAKESSKGCSQTKNLTFYQVKEKPIRVLDIPGFEDENSVKEAVKKLQECGKQINRLKEKIHIFLYFLNYSDVGTFMNLEYQIIKEIIKHKSSKIIYVITHSKQNLNDNDKKRKIRNINKGIANIMDKNKINDNGMFKATDNNIVFVNFHKDNTYNIEPFGTKELFQKIYEFFIFSDDFLNSFNNLDPQAIEENALKFRKRAQDVLLSNKISGALIGAVPIVDLIVQNYVIKKNAIRKAGEIFGFDIETIDKELAKENKALEKGLAEEPIENKIGNGIKSTTEAGGCIGGGISLGSGVVKAANASKMAAEATKLTTQAANIGAKAANMGAKAVEYGANAAKIGNEATKLAKAAGEMTVPWYLKIFGMGSEITTEATNLATKASNMAAESANLNSIATNLSSQAANMASQSTSLNVMGANMASKATITLNEANTLRYVGTGITIGSFILGISLGAYFTHKFCEELLDKFVDLYKKYPQKICNSYKEAAYYFYSMGQ